MKNNRTFLEKLLDRAEVKWIPLGDVADYEQPTKYLVNSTVYNDNYPTPVLTAGKTFILGYTNEDEGIYFASKSPVIIFDDFTTANKWVDFDFKAKSSAMKMITSKNEKFALLKYIYYWLNTLPNNQTDGDHKRQWISNYANKLIPIPPLPVQTRIVKILDALTALTSELTSELILRQKQYEYYREKLLSEEELGKVGFEWKTVKSLCNDNFWLMPATPEFDDNGNIPYITSKNIKGGKIDFQNTKYINEYVYQELSRTRCIIENDILISMIGTIGEAVIVKKEDLYFYGQNMYVLRLNNELVNHKFFLYYFTAPFILNSLLSKKNSSNQGYLKAGQIESLKIPIPPLPVQTKIVKILDKFETLTNSITEGLPLAIEQSQKRYEYYRELLLNFPGRE